MASAKVRILCATSSCSRARVHFRSCFFRQVLDLHVLCFPFSHDRDAIVRCAIHCAVSMASRRQTKVSTSKQPNDHGAFHDRYRPRLFGSFGDGPRGAAVAVVASFPHPITHHTGEAAAFETGGGRNTFPESSDVVDPIPEQEETNGNITTTSVVATDTTTRDLGHGRGRLDRAGLGGGRRSRPTTGSRGDGRDTTRLGRILHGVTKFPGVAVTLWFLSLPPLPRRGHGWHPEGAVFRKSYVVYLFRFGTIQNVGFLPYALEGALGILTAIKFLHHILE